MASEKSKIRAERRNNANKQVLSESGSDNETVSNMTRSGAKESGHTTKKSEPKYCGVCGDTALGYNFNAVTCESCKAFFRRNALKNKEFTCPFENKCKVDVVTRRFCQKCRLKKCFDIGMKKEWIMTEEEKKVKREKIEENRYKRHAARSSATVPKAKRLKSLPTSPLSMSSIASRTKVELVKPQAIVTGMPKQTATTSLSDSEASNTTFTTSTVHNENGTDSMDVLSPIANDDDVKIVPQGVESLVKDEVESSQLGPCDTGCHGSSANTEASMLKYKNSILAQELAAVQSPPPAPAVVATPTVTSDSVSENYSSIPDVMSPSTSSSFQDEICTSVMQLTSGRGGQSGMDCDESVPSTSWLKSEETDDAGSDDTRSVDGDKGGSRKPSSSSGLPFGKNSQEVINIEIAVRFAGVFMKSFVSNRKELSMEERRKLDELTDANEVMKMPLTVGLTDPSLLDVINLTDHAIRRLIKMSKKLAGFKNLCQDCQIALLKGSCTELMILRSVMSYVPEEDCWQGPKMKAIKVQVLKQARGNVYEEHKRFLNSFEASWRTDENIMLLLGAITLFTPERPNVAHKDVIKLEQIAYYYLLRRYLEVIYPECEAQTVFVKLIHNIQWLHNLNENHVRVFMDLNPKDVEPLLIEIFDLKHC